MPFISQTSLAGPSQLGTLQVTYNEVSSVGSGTTTQVTTFTNTTSKISYLQMVQCSGDNIARWDLIVNTTSIGTVRTEFTSLNDSFDFRSGMSQGYALNPGDVVVLNVLHNRPNLGMFEAQIQIVNF